MHIKIFTASVYQDYLSRYKELHQTKASKKCLINGYSQKMISSVSLLQDNSSEVVESNMQPSSRGMCSNKLHLQSYLEMIWSETGCFGLLGNNIILVIILLDIIER